MQAQSTEPTVTCFDIDATACLRMCCPAHHVYVLAAPPQSMTLAPCGDCLSVQRLVPHLFGAHLQVTMLCDLGSDTRSDEPTAVAWSPRGGYLTVGTKGGLVHLYDGASTPWLPETSAFTMNCMRDTKIFVCQRN